SSALPPTRSRSAILQRTRPAATPSAGWSTPRRSRTSRCSWPPTSPGRSRASSSSRPAAPDAPCTTNGDGVLELDARGKREGVQHRARTPRLVEAPERPKRGARALGAEDIARQIAELRLHVGVGHRVARVALRVVGPLGEALSRTRRDVDLRA